MPHKRFIDRTDKEKLIQSCPDFTLRRHGVPPSRVIYAFIALLLIVALVIIHLSITLTLLPDTAYTPLQIVFGFLLLVALLVVGVAVFSFLVMRKIRDVVLETEFQNLLFASAAAADTEFCVITNVKKVMVYYDEPFARMFSLVKGHSDDFEETFDQKGLGKKEKTKVLRAISDGEKLRLPVTISGRTLTLTVEPLRRPSGYVVVRAYA